jgi:hypothetical protein
MIGIYEWRIARPDEAPLVYVGKSKELENRRLSHIQQLGAGKHHNPRFQYEVERYGVGAVTFTVLQLFDSLPYGEEWRLKEAEVKWTRQRIEELGEENVLNRDGRGKWAAARAKRYVKA